VSKFRHPVKREIFFIHVVRTGRFGEGKSPGRKRPGIFTRFDQLWLQNELQTLDRKVLAFQERGRRPNSQSRLANGLAASTCSLFPSSNNLSPDDQHVMELGACWPRLRAGHGDLGRVVSCLGISAIEPPNSKDIVQVGCCNLDQPAPLAFSCRKDSGRRRIHRGATAANGLGAARRPTAIETPSLRAALRTATKRPAGRGNSPPSYSISCTVRIRRILRRQIGLKLRAADTCNLVYACGASLLTPASLAPSSATPACAPMNNAAPADI